MSSKGKSPVATGGASLVPKLRFPEFEEADGWKEIPLQKLARPVTERATTGDADNVLSLSGEHGLVLQSEYFGKKIASDSTDRYLKIHKNDFVYNDRTTKASSFGTIKRLSAYAGGIVSPIYKCFRFHPSETPAFWEWYFESGSHDPALGGLVNEGARAGRFNISVAQFLSTNARRPDEAEQQKIADCLDSADALIAAQGRKVEALRAHKKGLMQQLFPQEGETQPRLRFPEFEGAGEWEVKQLSEVATYENGKAYEQDIIVDGRYIVVNSRFISTEGAVKKHTNADYLIANTGDVLMVLSDLPKGRALAKCYFVGTNDRYAVNQRICRLKGKKIDAKFMFFILDRNPNLLAYDDGQTQTHLSKGNVLECPLCVPPTKAEQQRIADCLTSLDDLIAAEIRKLDALKIHKKGLMQQLFPQVAQDDA
jgi:type I restriction enzyme S subunit